MKKLLLVLLLLLLPLTALAEDNARYPAKGENGLYGYINARAEWVIAPQFDWAGDYRGDYALFMDIPEGMTEDEAWDAGCEGVIDRTGRIVVEPEYIFDSGYDGYFYGGEDTGIWVVWSSEGEEILEGFFDVPTGTFTGLKWYYVGQWCSDSDLIPVEGGYASRRTGEIVIEGNFEWVDPAYFHEGIASVALVLDEDTGETTSFFLMNEKGETIPLPEGVHSTYQGDYSCGRVLVESEDGLFGYADGTGRIVIPVQFPVAQTFAEGIAAVTFPEGDSGYIDVDGSVLVRGFDSAESFTCGYGEVELNGETRLIRADGTLAPFTDGDSYFPIREDRLWQGSGFRRSGPYHLVDGEGSILTAEPVDLMDFEPRDFTGGLQAVGNGEGKWGYIDMDGQLVIPYRYSAAYAFDGELAYVRLGDRVGYIDRAGNEVYMWTDPIR